MEAVENNLELVVQDQVPPKNAPLNLNVFACPSSYSRGQLIINYPIIWHVLNVKPKRTNFRKWTYKFDDHEACQTNI